MRNALWKSVENAGCSVRAIADMRGHLSPHVFGAQGLAPHAFGACSACAGDYEDPDRTAWAADPEDAEAPSEDRATREPTNNDEFPAPEA